MSDTQSLVSGDTSSGSSTIATNYSSSGNSNADNGSSSSNDTNNGTTMTTTMTTTKQRQSSSAHLRRKSGTIDYTDPFFAEDAILVGSSSLLSSPNVMEPDPPIGRTNPSVIIPTPSVYTDERGEIYNLCMGKHNTNTRINILHSKKGTMRGGDFHPNKQCMFVFTGRIEVWIPSTEDGSTRKKLVRAREYVEISPYIPHVEHYLEDTVHAEWWEDDDDNEKEASSSEGNRKKATTAAGQGSTEETSSSPPGGAKNTNCAGRSGSGSGSNNNNNFRHWFYAPYRRTVDASFGWSSDGRGRGTLQVLRAAGAADDDCCFLERGGASFREDNNKRTLSSKKNKATIKKKESSSGIDEDDDDDDDALVAAAACGSMTNAKAAAMATGSSSSWFSSIVWMGTGVVLGVALNFVISSRTALLTTAAAGRR